MENKSELGKLLYMKTKNGELVDDKVVLSLMSLEFERTKRPVYLIGGFPRSVPNLIAWI
jgi:adenylate kinase family enzyme